MKLTMQSLDNITWERLEQQAVTYPSLSPDDPGRRLSLATAFRAREGRARSPRRHHRPG